MTYMDEAARTAQRSLLQKLEGQVGDTPYRGDSRPPQRAERTKQVLSALAADARESAYQVVHPPSTAIMLPVIKDASSDARKTAAEAISSAVPSRFMGCMD